MRVPNQIQELSSVPGVTWKTTLSLIVGDRGLDRMNVSIIDNNLPFCQRRGMAPAMTKVAEVYDCSDPSLIMLYQGQWPREVEKWEKLQVLITPPHFRIILELELDGVKVVSWGWTRFNLKHNPGVLKLKRLKSRVHDPRISKGEKTSYSHLDDWLDNDDVSPLIKSARIISWKVFFHLRHPTRRPVKFSLALSRHN